MCGIVAIWAPRGGVVAADLDPVERLRHRGPDAATRWVSPDGRVGLAQARLAVVGVANGAQPVRAGAVRAVVNGEFYGYRERRRELAVRGHRFGTDSDSEIAVHLYEEDPDGFVDRLRGEFAVVLWDPARQRLLAVRDRFGVKPLYHSWIGGRLVLASEAKALFAAGAARRWDTESFHDYLHGCFAPDRSLFAGIHQVPPGSILRADPAGVTVSSYWDLDYPVAAETGDEPSVDAIRDRVAEAVRLRLVADVPVGFHLSGGLDSSAVVGAAAGHAPLRTFTVCFPGSPLDEGPVAARTAAALAADHHEVTLDAGTVAQAAEQTVVAGEMPQENHHGTARLAQSTAIARAGLRVALAGEGGDELFGGYPHHQADAALSTSPERLAHAARSHRALLERADQPTLSGTLARLGFLPGWLVERCLNTSLPVRPLLHRDVREAYARRDSLAAVIDRAEPQLRGRAPVHQSLYLFLRTWFCNYILAAERLDMARSVEVRLPLLDHELFALARRLSPATLAGTPGKRPLREAMRDVLTDEVYRGGKRPFFAPPSDGRAAAGALRRRVEAGALAGNRLLDPAAVDAFLHRVEAGSGPVSQVQDRMLHLVDSVATLHQAYRLEG